MSPNRPEERVVLTPEQIAAGLVEPWLAGADGVRAAWKVADFAAALQVVTVFAAAAEAADHHPDLELGWGYVKARLVSHDVDGVTVRDLRLASQFSAIAADLGAQTEQSR